jgi:hypothetical protein
VTHVFDQHDTAARVLVLTSRAFDFPAELPPNVRYVGPQLDDPDWTEPAELPPGDEPLVLVGMSSTFMDQADLLRRVVAALDQLPVRGLVTTGPEIEPSAVPGAARIRGVRSMPRYCGTPPPWSAMAALRLKSTATPGPIAAAMRRLLDEPGYHPGRRACRRAPSRHREQSRSRRAGRRDPSSRRRGPRLTGLRRLWRGPVGHSNIRCPPWPIPPGSAPLFVGVNVGVVRERRPIRRSGRGSAGLCDGEPAGQRPPWAYQHHLATQVPVLRWAQHAIDAARRRYLAVRRGEVPLIGPKRVAAPSR